MTVVEPSTLAERAAGVIPGGVNSGQRHEMAMGLVHCLAADHRIGVMPKRIWYTAGHR